MAESVSWNGLVYATFEVTIFSGPELDNTIYVYDSTMTTLIDTQTCVNGQATFNLDVGVYDIEAVHGGYTGQIVDNYAVTGAGQSLIIPDLVLLPYVTAEFVIDFPCVDCGWWPGPFQAGMSQVNLADFMVRNTGTGDGLVYWEIRDFPGTQYESLIAEGQVNMTAGCDGLDLISCGNKPGCYWLNNMCWGSTSDPIQVLADVPSVTTFQVIYPGQDPPWDWPICARVAGADESFDPCPAAATFAKVVPRGFNPRKL